MASFHVGQKPFVVATLVVIQLLAGFCRGNATEVFSSTALTLPARLSIIEGLKLLISFVLFHFSAKRHSYALLRGRELGHDVEEVEESLLTDLSPRGPNYEVDEPDALPPTPSPRRGRLSFGTMRSMLLLAVLAFMNFCRTHFALSVSELADAMTVHLFSTPLALFSAFLLYSLVSRHVATLQWCSMLLQVCGLLIANNSYPSSHSSQATYCLLIALTLSTSLINVLTEHVYKSHGVPSISSLNIVLFAFTLILHFLYYLFPVLLGSAEFPSFPTFSSIPIGSLLVHAAGEVACIHVIFQHDAIVAGVATSLSSAILMLLLRGVHQQLSLTVLLGGGLASFGSWTYLRSIPEPQDRSIGQTTSNIPATQKRSLWAAVSVVVLSAYIVITSISGGLQQRIFKPSTPLMFADFTYLPPSIAPDCRRKELPSLSYWPRTRTYHEFDDVLLIVFFSHARYDVNLDYYKSVYSEFFPNIVFVGPGSREDAGFAHSYDVLVDSYQSDEDLSDPTYYKMAGRMAHHMLYTVMSQHDCYDGYLWVPFDTFLNIARLHQFRQDRFWYHSPFAEYVPNAAMGDDWNDATMHPPPLNISPDPALNLTETYRGWRTDWWWGEPHVGLDVCMRAFRNVPPEMRARLALQTNGTRLLGGSADTLYIPAHSREDFLRILGLFLDTDCFLEIAVPTTVHLVVRPEQPILFVDHWWIWRPPFNATFVRNVWERGMEVDTFHTFHWGDKDENGVWRGIPENVNDVRRLQAESAARQGVRLA